MNEKLIESLEHDLVISINVMTSHLKKPIENSYQLRHMIRHPFYIGSWKTTGEPGYSKSSIFTMSALGNTAGPESKKLLAISVDDEGIAIADGSLDFDITHEKPWKLTFDKRYMLRGFKSKDVDGIEHKLTYNGNGLSNTKFIGDFRANDSGTGNFEMYKSPYISDVFVKQVFENMYLRQLEKLNFD